jgi:beta-phosphoglucomutase
MLKAVIFDFDGVIVDSELLHFRAFNKIAAQFNIEIPKEQYFADFLGLNDREVFEILVDNHKLTDYKDKTEQLVEQKTAVFKQLAASEGQIIDGVPDFLAMLDDNRIPMSICSGALEAEIIQILKASSLTDYFTTIVAADHVTKGKPDPQGFLLALEQLNEASHAQIQPSECIVVEDSIWGLQGARNAGMHPLAVTNTYRAETLKPAEMVVDRLSDLKISDLQALCA